MMGNIVRIDETPHRGERRSTDPKNAKSAEIVIFPGVRYERWDDDRPAAGSGVKSGSGVRRDFIEL